MGSEFWKELAITQTTTAAISFVASSTLATCVLLRAESSDPPRGGISSSQSRSKRFLACRGLSSPFRRIIFGLSVSDMMQSFAVLVGPWMTVQGVPLAPWGKGNKHTCRFAGLLLTIGYSAVPMYTLFLW